MKNRCFNIVLDGPPASGKTIAMEIIEKALKDAGYRIDKSRNAERGFEHALSVRWGD